MAGAAGKDGATEESGREVVVSEPTRALVVAEGRRLTRRRARRWGQAARRAAQREVADGGKAGPRSLRAVREGFPYSQDELAEKTRMSRTTISELERGLRRAQPATRRAIARVLGVGVGEILW